MKKIMVLLSIIVVVLMQNVYAQPKSYIQLEKPNLNKGKLLMQALKMRKSSRNFSSKELSLGLISNLLWAANGINRDESGDRTSPSAHNSQEIDIYVAMKDGMYLYNASSHALELVLAKDIREFTGVQKFTQIAPVNLIYVANLSKLRGDDASKKFYSATDSGFISQNVYLFAAQEGLATVVLGWVDKEKLADVMGLGEEQKVILTQPVGYVK